MNISEREIKSSCTKALRQLSISHEMNTFIDYVAKGQVANAETELKQILEKSGLLFFHIVIYHHD